MVRMRSSVRFRLKAPTKKGSLERGALFLLELLPVSDCCLPAMDVLYRIYRIAFLSARRAQRKGRAFSERPSAGQKARGPGVRQMRDPRGQVRFRLKAPLSACFAFALFFWLFARCSSNFIILRQRCAYSCEF